MSAVPEFQPVCPVPISRHSAVLMAHGGGGRLTQQLLEQIFWPAFRNDALEARHDGAVLPTSGGRLAFTTDSFVVKPWAFPGGDIGSLSVFGTVNDLAMCGAIPRWLSAGFILEEGFPLEALRTVVLSMASAAKEAGVQIVTGDTKVVERGKGDGIYVNTAGVGEVPAGRVVAPGEVRPGDTILVSGDLGRHGMAIMSVREGLAFETPIVSDCACLAPTVERLFQAGVRVRCLRDLTRGGLASALNEVASTRRVAIEVKEDRLPVHETVRGACEVLGLDPLYVANEGRFVAFVDPADAERALGVLREGPGGAGATVAGVVKAAPAGLVTLRSTIGSVRVLDLLSGEQLPRIC